MADVNVGVVISAEDRASAVLTRVKGSLSNLSTTVENLEPAFKTMAYAGTVTFAAIGAAIYKSVQSAVDADAIQTRLAQTLRTSTHASDVQIQALSNQADALERVGVVSADVIRQGQGQLAAFDLQSESIQRLIPSILNYAVAEKGMNMTTEDLQAVTNGLAQALQGNFASLTKTGFVLDEATKKLISNGTETERVAALAQVLDSTYAGMNETMRSTTKGGIVGMQFAMDKLSQTIGTALTPAINRFFAAVTPVIEKVAAWVEQNPKLTATLFAVIGGIAGLTAVLGTLGIVLSAITPALIAAGVAIAGMLGPITLVVGALSGLAALISERLNYSYDEAAKRSEELGAQSDHLRLRLAALRAPIEADSEKLKELGDKAAEAAKKVADMQQQITDATEEHEARNADIKQSVADAAIDQEKKVADLRKNLEDERTQYVKDLSNGMILDDQRKAQDHIDILYRQLQQEEQALSNFYLRNNDLNTQLSEARRRSNETDFERHLEDLARQSAEEDKRFQKTVARLNAELAALLEEKAKALKAEQEYTSSLERENAKRLEDYKSTLIQARAISAGGVFGAFPSISTPSSSTSSLFGFAASTVSRINDAIISPRGDIITTAPDDYLIATKTPGNLGGSRNININISGAVLSQDAARVLGDMIMGNLRMQLRV